MDSGDDPNAARNRGSTRGSASPPPAMDDGADPNAAAGHPPREPTRERLSRDDWVPIDMDDPFPLGFGPMSARLGSRLGLVLAPDLGPSAARLQASSSAAPPSETEERPSEGRSSELGSAVTDLPTLEVLSLMNELPLWISDDTSEDSDDDVDEEHHSEARSMLGDLSSIETMSASDTQAPLEESYFEYDKMPELPGYHTCGKHFPFFPPPKGISISMVLADSLTIFVSDDEEQPKSDSDVDSDESQSETEESAPPYRSFRELLESVWAVEQATLTALAAEWGTEPPSAVIARDAAEAPRQQETRSLQAEQQDSAAATQRHEASTEDIVLKGKKWMCEEVMLCFKKHIERRPDLVGLEYKLDELCHQCFNVDSYNKVFHHYNFRVMMKMPSSVDWTVELYFAEVKEIFGRKYYFCCALEQDEDGDCYACKNQGVEDLKHPATGGFDTGSPDAQCSLW